MDRGGRYHRRLRRFANPPHRRIDRSTRTFVLQPPATDKEIDTRGLNCPLPILRAKKALSDMTTGQVLKIVATDPGSMHDFQAFCKQTGNQLLMQESVNKEFVHFVKRR